MTKMTAVWTEECIEDLSSLNITQEEMNKMRQQFWNSVKQDLGVEELSEEQKCQIVAWFVECCKEDIEWEERNQKNHESMWE